MTMDLFQGYKVEKTRDESIVKIYINPSMTEFSKEFGSGEEGEKVCLEDQVREYIQETLPDLKAAFAKVMIGSLLISTIPLMETQVFASEQSAVEQRSIQNGEKIVVIIDGKVQQYPKAPVLIDQITYVPLREICESVGATVWWNGESKTVGIKKQDANIAFIVGNGTANVNGSTVPMPTTYIIDGKTMVPLRFVSEILGYHVEWNGEYRAAVIRTNMDHRTEWVPTEPPPAPKQPQVQVKNKEMTGYSEEDLYWLARIVHAESEAESYEAKLAVANVILNRVKSEEFPNTVRQSIFDTKNGVQFQPTANGRIYHTPSMESIQAATEALEGRNNAEGALFFFNPSIARSFWIMNNRRFAFRIGDHDFYY
jgi:N-acetylmuramoyl-L-alanine amidase